MTIVFAGDSQYYDYMKLALMSPHLENYKKVVLVPELDESVNKFFSDWAELKVVDLLGLGLHDEGHVSVMTYARLVLPWLLTDLDSVLYMDSDVLVEGDLCLKNAVSDAYDIVGVRDSKVNEINYINAGVIGMNLSRIRNNYDKDTLLKHAASKLWRFWDQDVINDFFICDDSLNPKMNVQDFSYEGRRAIRHFVGTEKPWTNIKGCPSVKAWRRAYLRAVLFRRIKGNFKIFFICLKGVV